MAWARFRTGRNFSLARTTNVGADKSVPVTPDSCHKQTQASSLRIIFAYLGNATERLGLLSKVNLFIACNFEAAA